MATQDVIPGAMAMWSGLAAHASLKAEVSPCVVGATGVGWLNGTSFNDAHGDAAMRLAAAKLRVGVVALALVLAERQGRPAASLVQWGGLGPAALPLVLHFLGARVDGGGLAHRHEQFHFYMGAKYFPELDYRRLYLCALVAQDEIGPVRNTNQHGGRWAFGWRVTCLAAIFLGCNAMAPVGWTGGGLPRQDWLFLLMLSACLMRKQHFGWAGARLAANALLRVFPELVVLGLLSGSAVSAWRHRRWQPADLRALAGGAVASAVRVAASVWVSGLQAYEAFYRHTLVVHDQTPLANHMGLRVPFSQGSVLGDAAGTMKARIDLAAPDMWHHWKQVRLQNYQANRAAMYIVVGLALVAAVGLAMRRPVSRWAGLCLGSVWMVLMAQLTCYYYTLLLLCAPLAHRYPRVELALLGLAVASQGIVVATTWLDFRYTLLSAACVVFCGALWWIVWGAPRRAQSPRSAPTEAADLS